MNLTNMVKKSPCKHCGIETTPPWHNGLEEKPVLLCNACGSRYSSSGTLDESYSSSRTLQLYFPKHFHSTLLKKLQDLEATSSDLNGGKNVVSLWNTKIPSRKRSRVAYRKMTEMEKFTSQLRNLYWYGEPERTEEVLLEQRMNNFIPNNEIGLGAMLLKPDDAPTSPKKIRAN